MFKPHNKQDSNGKQTPTETSVPAPEAEANIASVLNGEDYGLTLKGMIVMVEPPVHREGKSRNGNEYSMDIQTAAVSLGSKIIKVEFSSFDPEIPLPTVQLGSVIELDVEEGYMSGRQFVVKGTIK